MEIERRYASIPADLQEYLRANPSPPAQHGDGGQHVHIHHHYAAPAVPEGMIVRQGPEKSVAEKVLPWVWLMLAGCIVLTICAVVLATVLLVVVAVLAALALLGAVLAYIIRSQGISLAVQDEARARRTDAERKKDAAERRRKRR